MCAVCIVYFHPHHLNDGVCAEYTGESVNVDTGNDVVTASLQMVTQMGSTLHSRCFMMSSMMDKRTLQSLLLENCLSALKAIK